MKLAAIYNIWDGRELLDHSIKHIEKHVDVIILVFQHISNFGEEYHHLKTVQYPFPFGRNLIFMNFEPEIGFGARNEIKKRNLGLEKAKELGCTHFLHMDCDEVYPDFGKAKELYINSGKEGSVCKIFTYFKEPTLRFETEDGYFVPFIHKLRTDTMAGMAEYPFWVDPTRRINCNDVVLLDVHMHHFSWVRDDIERKIRNSSAKRNLERGTMLEDYNNPDVGPGFYVRDYDKKLIRVENLFGIKLNALKPIPYWDFLGNE